MTGCRAAAGKGRPAAQKSRSNELTDRYRVSKHKDVQYVQISQVSLLVNVLADRKVVGSNIIRHPVLLASSKEEGVEGTNSAIKLVGSLLFAPPPPPSP